MSSFQKAQKRWNWINGWLTAALHACINGAGLSVDSKLSITSLINQYSEKIQKQLAVLEGISSSVVQDWEVDYVLQLEEELWGPDWKDYTSFFSQSEQSNMLLQTFHFVLSFYIIERCLKLLVSARERYRISHRGLRRRIFGLKDGLFTVKLPQAMGAMGPPFFLAATTKRVEVVGAPYEMWGALRGEPVPQPLEQFYRAVTGKSHFVEIVEKALISTRRDHVKKTFQKKKGERLPQGTRAYWYDVLWHYSESIRYNPLLPSPESVKQPFYWNRTIRWFTSTAVTAILLIAQKRGVPINAVWRTRAKSDFGQALGGHRRFANAP